MLIQYLRGDFIDGSEDVIVHGCNAQGVMGRGAAKAVRERLPFAFDEYLSAYLQEGLSLGNVVWAINVKHNERLRIVGNLITQEHWRQDLAVDGRNVDYDAVRMAFRKVREFVQLTQDGTITIPKITPVHRIGMPLVGCGLGGGEWSIVKEIIETESQTCFTPIVYLLDGNLPVE